MQTEIHEGQVLPDDNAIYHADTSRIGKSGLDLVAKSPAHYYAQYLDPSRKRSKQTAAMFIGSAVHTAVLEPTEFLKRYVVMDDRAKCAEIGGKNPKATTKYKDWVAEFEASNTGKDLLTNEEFAQCIAIKDAVYANPSAALLLEKGLVEERIDFTHPVLGVACKIKPDFQSTNRGFIVDLKTTEDASPEGFAKSVWNYRYDVQAAFYSDGYQAAKGQVSNGFIFIAVEKSPPFAVGVYYVTPEIFDIGRKRYMKDLEVYKECLRTNTWPAFGDAPQPLQLPGWAYKSINQ